MAQLQDLLNKEVVNKLYDIHANNGYFDKDMIKALELDAKKLEDLQSTEHKETVEHNRNINRGFPFFDTYDEL